MTLTIIKNAPRDFDHVTEFKSLSIGYYNMILDNTLQTVVIKMPNGSQFPNDAIGVNNVFFQDNTDAGAIEPFATTELLKARLIEVDYNGLVEASGGGSGAVDSVNGQTGVVVLDADDISDTSTTKKFTNTTEKNTWNNKQDALTFDTTPTNGSANPVTSGGVFDALTEKADAHIFLRLITTNTLTSNTSAQNLFNIGYNGGTAGEIPIEAGLYDFEIKLYGTNFSATSGFISFNFGGTSVIDSILYYSYVSKASGVGVGVAVPITRAITTVSQITLTNTGTVCHGVLNGTIAISTAGTIIPQITMSQASASVIQPNTQITFSKKSDTYNATN